MRGLVSVLAGLMALALGASGALAGGSLKDEPVVEARTCASGPFAGAYIGGAVGGGRHDGEFSDELGSGSVSADDGSFTGGGYAGYSIQCDRLVIGIESDINYFGADSSWTDVCCYTLTSEFDWFGTVRGRIGLVHEGNTLFYVTGGLAYADVDHTFEFAPFGFSQSDSDLEFGWTVGGGIEFIRDNKWSLRAEALYVDLGTETIDYQDAACGISCTARVGWEDEFWVARVGLAYHFGQREEVVPLK